MKPNLPSDKDWHLYNYKWNIGKDTYLINRLVERESECKAFPSPADSPHTLICAMEALNKEMQADLTYNDVLDRVKFLRMCYECFKKLTNRTETTWDVENNRVTANEKVWKVIFGKGPFARAYHLQGDPLWSKLCCLFGYNTIKEEPSPAVVVISNSPRALHALSNQTHISISDDEVTSPQLKDPTARKLVFNDDVESRIRPSAPPTTHAYYVWPPIETRFAFSPTNAFPRKPAFGDDKINGAEHSSCASSSPFK